MPAGSREEGRLVPAGGFDRVACVVLPTYNEAANVAALLPQIFAQQPAIPTHALHVLVVDDESPDGTADVVRSLMERFPALHLVTGRKQGLGAAYQRGIAYALERLGPELVFEMDADGQHSPALLPLFVTLANNGFDLVIGSRFAPGGSTPDFSVRRRLLSLLGNWMVRFFGGLPRIHDCTSGYRCIRATFLAHCDFSHLSTRGYSFQSSLLFELLRNHARPIEVPIQFSSRLAGESKLSLRDQVEFLLNIARIRFRTSRQFLCYAAVGGAGAVVNMAVYYLLTRPLSVPLEMAAPIAIEVSLLSNFVMNGLWTFPSERTASWPVRLVRFHLVAMGAALTNYGMLLGLVHLAGMPDLAANVLGIAVGSLINYYANSVWTWKQVEREETAERPKREST